MKQTTALRKIIAIKKRIRGVQGGQGAGKSIAIMMIIINHCAGNAGREAYVVSAELSKMRDTILKDSIKILQSFGVPAKVLGADSGQAKIIFLNGSFIRFIGMDKDDIGKGLRSDIIFVNEANKIGFEAYRAVTDRAKNVFIDFNPDAKFWFHEEVVTRRDCEHIKLTYIDNEYLPKEEVYNILYNYEKGYGFEYDPSDPDANTYEPISKYWANKWKVYGLGEIGILEGAVYENWEIIDELPAEAKILGGGIDFGWVHPQSAIAAYEWEGRRIYDQLSYGSYKGTIIMANDIKESGLELETFYCDNSAPQLISELNDNGINAHPCDGKTGLINFSVDKMNKEVFYVTARSVDIINELYGYTWDKDSKGVPTGKPIKLGDDAMNAIQYFEGSEGKYDGTYR